MAELRAVESQEQKPATGLAQQQGISITLGQCLAAEVALAKLAQQPTGPKLRHHLAKLLRLVREEVKDFIGQQELLIKEYGALRAPTAAEHARGQIEDVMEVTVANRLAYFAKLKELNEVQTTISWTPLALTDLDMVPNATADDELNLGPCVEER